MFTVSNLHQSHTNLIKRQQSQSENYLILSHKKLIDKSKVKVKCLAFLLNNTYFFKFFDEKYTMKRGTVSDYGKETKTQVLTQIKVKDEKNILLYFKMLPKKSLKII